MNIIGYVKNEYKELVRDYIEFKGSINHWSLLSDLAMLNCLVPEWSTSLDTYLRTEHGVGYYEETEKDLRSAMLDSEYYIENNHGEKIQVLIAEDRDATSIQILKLSEVKDVYYTLPYKRTGYNPDPRLLTDLILTDAKNLSATDIHFSTFMDYDNKIIYEIKFRLGIYLHKQTKYPINSHLLESIIADLLSNRSNVSHKYGELAVESGIRFRLNDTRFPARCQVAKTFVGKSLVTRMFDFKEAPSIERLGFNTSTQNMLRSLSDKLGGLSLVTGTFGSGKGTTLNAVGKRMEEKDKYSIASLDDPIEYLRRYNQYEYSNEQQLQDYVEAFKKMDLNVVYLNEVITSQAAEAVFNLVSAGVHVLTTLHTNRAYDTMYKLEELLGSKYVSLIPFLNVISYQDKFSVCCKDCVSAVHRDSFKDNSPEKKLLDFFKLEIIKQPQGCPKCNKGIINKGIKVVSEHIQFNDTLKSALLKLNIHEQFDLLKQEVENQESLEQVLAKELSDGKVLIDEVLTKLDTWR